MCGRTSRGWCHCDCHWPRRISNMTVTRGAVRDGAAVGGVILVGLGLGLFHPGAGLTAVGLLLLAGAVWGHVR